MEKEFVCHDDDGDWYYFPESLQYKRFLGDVIRSMIPGYYLPDPDILLAKRRLLYPDAAIEKISPTAATRALWKHWNELNAPK